MRWKIRTEDKYRPVERIIMNGDLDLSTALFKVSVRRLTAIACFLPAFATIFCVTWSVWNNFEASTRTHCKVQNFLPSISAAIGDFKPQVYVWRLCIALHCGLRFLLALIYYGFHTSLTLRHYNERYMLLAALCSLLHIIENGALLGLSYVSSSDNFGVHKIFFGIFMFCADVYMILTMIVFYWGRTHNGRQLTQVELKSLKLKKILCGMNLGVFMLAMYFYYEHGNSCKHNVYSYFAFCEYLVIFTNIGYHGTAMLDFKPQQLLIQAPMRKSLDL